MKVLPGEPQLPQGRAGWVVLAVVLGAAVAVILPAVQKVRAAAARANCQSHLKQLALAHHNYASAFDGRLPAGTVHHPVLPPEGRLSWYVSVLPYFEQAELHRRFDLAAGWDQSVNRAPAGTPLQWFRCPAINELAPVCHLVGSAGSGADAAALPAGHLRAGALGYDRRAPLDRDGFPDGTANTLLLVDDGRDPGPWARGGPATVRGLDPAAGPPGWRHTADTGGRPPVTPVAFADGAVRLLAGDTTPAVLAALATAAGGDSLPPD